MMINAFHTTNCNFKADKWTVIIHLYNNINNNNNSLSVFQKPNRKLQNKNFSVTVQWNVVAASITSLRMLRSYLATVYLSKNIFLSTVTVVTLNQVIRNKLLNHQLNGTLYAEMALHNHVNVFKEKKSNYGRVYLFLYLKIPINQIKHFIMQKKIPIYEFCIKK